MPLYFIQGCKELGPISELDEKIGNFMAPLFQLYKISKDVQFLDLMVKKISNRQHTKVWPQSSVGGAQS